MACARSTKQVEKRTNSKLLTDYFPNSAHAVLPNDTNMVRRHQLQNNNELNRYLRITSPNDRGTDGSSGQCGRKPLAKCDNVRARALNSTRLIKPLLTIADTPPSGNSNALGGYRPETGASHIKIEANMPDGRTTARLLMPVR